MHYQNIHALEAIFIRGLLTDLQALSRCFQYHQLLPSDRRNIKKICFEQIIHSRGYLDVLPTMHDDEKNHNYELCMIWRMCECKLHKLVKQQRLKKQYNRKNVLCHYFPLFSPSLLNVLDYQCNNIWKTARTQISLSLHYSMRKFYNQHFIPI